MRFLLLFLILFLHDPAQAAVYRCEYLLTAAPGRLEPLYLGADRLLLWGLDFTDDIQTPSVASGLSAKALRVFNLDKIAPARYTRLRMTSRFDDEHGAEISLFVNTQEKHLKRLSSERRNELYFWKRARTYDDSRRDMTVGRARLPKGAHVGFYLERLPEYSVYVSMVPLSGRSYQINIGLDVDCESVDEYVNTRRFVEKIQKTDGMKCRVPVLRIKGAVEPQ